MRNVGTTWGTLDTWILVAFVAAMLPATAAAQPERPPADRAVELVDVQGVVHGVVTSVDVNGGEASLETEDGPVQVRVLDEVIASLEGTLAALQGGEAIHEVRNTVRAYRAATRRGQKG